MSHRFLYASLAFLFCVALACAQEKPPATTIPLEPWVLHAKLIHEVLPEYPTGARANHVQGNVYVNVLVDENGKIKTATAENCLQCSAILNDAALEAVKKWEYQPTIVNGNPVSVRSYIIFHFQLEKEPAVEVLTRSESTDPVKPLPAHTLDGRGYVIGSIIRGDSPLIVKPSPVWKEYVFAIDLFKISSPTVPLFEKQFRSTPSGSKEVHKYTMLSGRIRYTITYETLQASDRRSPDKVLKEIKKSLAQSALPNTEKFISVGKYPGLEAESEDDSTHSRARIVIANHGLYIVMATRFKNEPFPEDLQRWDDSLQFLEAQK